MMKAIRLLDELTKYPVTKISACPETVSLFLHLLPRYKADHMQQRTFIYEEIYSFIELHIVSIILMNFDSSGSSRVNLNP